MKRYIHFPFLLVGVLGIGCAQYSPICTKAVTKIRFGEFVQTGTFVEDSLILTSAHGFHAGGETVPFTVDDTPVSIEILWDGWAGKANDPAHLSSESVADDRALLSVSGTYAPCTIEAGSNDRVLVKRIYLISISKSGGHHIQRVNRLTLGGDIAEFDIGRSLAEDLYLSGSPLVAVDSDGSQYIIGVVSGVGFREDDPTKSTKALVSLVKEKIF